MRQDFVDKLELQLLAAAEREARGGLLATTARVARRRSYWRLAPAVAAAVVAAVGAILAAQALRSEDAVPAKPGPRLVAHTKLVSAGGSMATAAGSVWVADIDGGRVLRLDPRTRAVEARIPLGGAAWINTAAGSVWALGSDWVLRIDPATNRIVARIDGGSPAPGILLQGRGAVWIAYPDGLVRIDPRRNKITRTIPTSPAGYKNLGAASDGRILYLTRADGRLLRVDARTGKRVSAVRAAAVGPLIGVADGTVLVASDTGVAAVDAATGQARWSRDLHAERINAGALGGSTIWVQATDRASQRDRLWRLDARSGRVAGSLALPEFGAASMVAVGQQAWTMSTAGELEIAR
jgi:outer membrane protein assembly factor BamB